MSDNNNQIILNQEGYAQLMTKLGEIGSDIKAMHRRQDITNGRIATSESKIVNLEKADIKLDDKLDKFIGSISQYKTSVDAEKKEKKESQRYWFRKVAERVLWFVLFVVGIVLTKLGIINISF